MRTWISSLPIRRQALHIGQIALEPSDGFDQGQLRHRLEFGTGGDELHPHLEQRAEKRTPVHDLQENIERGVARAFLTGRGGRAAAGHDALDLQQSKGRCSGNWRGRSQSRPVERPGRGSGRAWIASSNRRSFPFAASRARAHWRRPRLHREHDAGGHWH